MSLPTIEISPPGSGSVSQQLAFTWNGAGDDDWHSFSSSSESYLLFLSSSSTYQINAYRLTAQAASGYTFQRFEITYDTDEIGAPAQGGNTYISGYLDTVAAKKQSSGSTFRRLIGDYSETSGSYSYSYHVTGIKAVFDQGTPPATTYTISAYSSPQNSGTVQVGNAESGATSSQSVEVGGSVNIVATAASGYAFKGWYLGNTLVSSSATYTVSNVTAAQTFEARFVPVYTIEVVSYSSWGTVSLSGGTDESFTGFNVKRRVVESGTQVTIGAYSNNSSVWPFKAWYIVPYVGANPDNMGTLVPGAGSQYTTTVTSNIVYHAKFYDPASISVSAVADSPYEHDYGNPDVSLTINGVATGSLDVRDGSSVTIAAPVDGGTSPAVLDSDVHFYFSHWTLSGQVVSTNPSYTFQANATAENNYVAHYKPYYQLDTAVAPNSAAGSISVSPASQHGNYYEIGTSITLTATPNTGYRFSKWTSTNGGESVNAAHNVNVVDINGVTWTANFVQEGYSIIYTAVNPQSEAYRTTISGGGTYQNGTQCTLQVTPHPNKRFVLWQAASGVYSRENPVSFKVTHDDTWTAFLVNSSGTYLVILTFVNPEGGGYVNGGTVHILHNSYPSIPAYPNSGYRFVWWVSEDGTIKTSNAIYYSDYLYRDTWTAYFAPTGKLLVAAMTEPSEGGTVSGDGAFDAGDTCTLVATPKVGFRFIKWTSSLGGENNNATFSFTVSADVVWIAHFDRTHLLVNSSSLSTPVQLVYDESSGLLVADY